MKNYLLKRLLSVFYCIGILMPCHFYAAAPANPFGELAQAGETYTRSQITQQAIDAATKAGATSDVAQAAGQTAAKMSDLGLKFNPTDLGTNIAKATKAGVSLPKAQAIVEAMGTATSEDASEDIINGVGETVGRLVDAGVEVSGIDIGMAITKATSSGMSLSEAQAMAEAMGSASANGASEDTAFAAGKTAVKMIKAGLEVDPIQTGQDFATIFKAIPDIQGTEDIIVQNAAKPIIAKMSGMDKAEALKKFVKGIKEGKSAQQVESELVGKPEMPVEAPVEAPVAAPTVSVRELVGKINKMTPKEITNEKYPMPRDFSATSAGNKLADSVGQKFSALTPEQQAQYAKTAANRYYNAGLNQGDYIKRLQLQTSNNINDSEADIASMRAQGRTSEDITQAMFNKAVANAKRTVEMQMEAEAQQIDTDVASEVQTAISKMPKVSTVPELPAPLYEKPAGPQTLENTIVENATKDIGETPAQKEAAERAARNVAQRLLNEQAKPTGQLVNVEGISSDAIQQAATDAAKSASENVAVVERIGFASETEKEIAINRAVNYGERMGLYNYTPVKIVPQQPKLVITPRQVTPTPEAQPKAAPIEPEAGPSSAPAAPPLPEEYVRPTPTYSSEGPSLAELLAEEETPVEAAPVPEAPQVPPVSVSETAVVKTTVPPTVETVAIQPAPKPLMPTRLPPAPPMEEIPLSGTSAIKPPTPISTTLSRYQPIKTGLKTGEQIPIKSTTGQVSAETQVGKVTKVPTGEITIGEAPSPLNPPTGLTESVPLEAGKAAEPVFQVQPVQPTVTETYIKPPMPTRPAPPIPKTISSEAVPKATPSRVVLPKIEPAIGKAYPSEPTGTVRAVEMPSSEEIATMGVTAEPTTEVAMTPIVMPTTPPPVYTPKMPTTLPPSLAPQRPPMPTSPEPELPPLPLPTNLPPAVSTEPPQLTTATWGETEYRGRGINVTEVPPSLETPKLQNVALPPEEVGVVTRPYTNPALSLPKKPVVPPVPEEAPLSPAGVAEGTATRAATGAAGEAGTVAVGAGVSPESMAAMAASEAAASQAGEGLVVSGAVAGAASAIDTWAVSAMLTTLATGAVEFVVVQAVMFALSEAITQLQQQLEKKAGITNLTLYEANCSIAFEASGTCHTVHWTLGTYTRRDLMVSVNQIGLDPSTKSMVETCIPSSYNVNAIFMPYQGILVTTTSGEKKGDHVNKCTYGFSLAPVKQGEHISIAWQKIKC